jgi:signal transduction histidine kinase
MSELSLLILEDNPDDVRLLERELRREGFSLAVRVEQTADALREALGDPGLQMILSDYHMPQLNALQAVDIVRDSRRDIPLIVVSGSIGESSAVEVLKRGAADFVLKDSLARLVPAIERELREVVVRRERAEADAALREAVQARDDFLSVASHELRTPLTTLQLQMNALTKAADEAKLDERLQRRMLIAARAADRLAKLIERVLDVNRIAAGRLTLERVPGVDLGALVSEIVAELAPAVDGAGCNVDVSASADVTGSWDPEALKVVVANLLTNATKYGADKPIHVGVDGDADTARLTVSDHGIGISKKDQQRIFDRFERAVSHQHYGGFGVGLWQSRQLVELQGGTIRVESEPGRGATFVVELPREK